MSDVVEQPTPVTDVDKHVNDVIDDLSARKVKLADRGRLDAALQKANAPPTGRPAQDDALGRISRRG